ncbi:MAG TPA: hypothetical protein VD836_08070 [Solirubrobacteraceae bacterium]|nr:hypothetical protein [Solirubrobacteraceae bacterium]
MVNVELERSTATSSTLRRDDRDLRARRGGRGVAVGALRFRRVPTSEQPGVELAADPPPSSTLSPIIAVNVELGAAQDHKRRAGPP